MSLTMAEATHTAVSVATLVTDNPHLVTDTLHNNN